MFPFDSDRKRMSIITEENGVYKLYIKGADSEIIQRLCLSQPQPFLEKTQKALDDFSVSGLRTLVYAMKVLSKAEFESYWNKFNQAQISSDKQKQLAELSNFMDRNLFLMGCTAIEDKPAGQGTREHPAVLRGQHPGVDDHRRQVGDGRKHRAMCRHYHSCHRSV